MTVAVSVTDYVTVTVSWLTGGEPEGTWHRCRLVVVWRAHV